MAGKKTLVEQLEEIIGLTPELELYKKYQRLLSMEPGNKSFKQSFELNEAKVQTQVSKAFTECTKKLKQFDVQYMKDNQGSFPSLADYSDDEEIIKTYRKKKMAQKFFQYWKIRYY